MIKSYPEVPLLQQDLITNTNAYYPNRTFGFAVGRNSAVNNVLVDLWEGPTGTYVFPPAGGIQMQIVSTSANDTAAGTGIQTVFVGGLDSSYNPINFTLTLNGTTPVTTVATNILRINEMHAATVGTGGVAAGNISLQAVGGATTYGYISAGNNSARQAIFTIPAGKHGYLNHWQGSSGTSTGAHFTQIRVRATSHNGVLYPGVFLTVDENGTLNNGGADTLPIPFVFPPTTDIKMSAISDSGSAGAIVTGAMFGWYE